MMSTTVKRIEGRMSNTAGDSFLVSLDAAVTELRGTSGVEDASISSLALAADNPRIPDGEYVMEYFFGKPLHEQVRVKLGVRMAI
jgi:hypothetical protein